MRAVTKFIHNKACHKLALPMPCQQALFTQTVRALSCAFSLSACCLLSNQVMRILSVNVLRVFCFMHSNVARTLNCLTQRRIRAYPMQRALCNINPLSFITHGLWVVTHSTNMRHRIMARLIVPRLWVAFHQAILLAQLPYYFWRQLVIIKTMLTKNSNVMLINNHVEYLSWGVE